MKKQLVKHKTWNWDECFTITIHIWKPIKYVYGGSLDGSYLYENGKKDV